ncbi:MAG: anthranilate synthase component I family protein [Myxococcaceae bacterium]|nr:anthranilate synthase component I family protein [Myxococcaceae bacterium]
MPIAPALSWREFARLCRPDTRIPVTASWPSDTETPVAAFLKLAQRAPRAFLFESVEGPEHAGRWTFLGVGPRRVIRWKLGQPGHPLDAIRDYLQRPATPVEGLPPFAGGLVGHVSYDAVRAFEPRVPCRHDDELHFPDALWMEFPTTLAFDAVRRTVHATHLVDVTTGASPRALYADAVRRLRGLHRALARPLPRPPARARTKARVVLEPRLTKAQFVAAVRRAKEAVRAGDCQQIVLSQRFDAQSTLDPFSLYRVLRRVNPSPYLFFVRDGDRSLAGSSPETLVKLRDRRITLRPIAGTRPRGATSVADERLEAELRADVKENAEHVMLVDLGRNDVGRVSTTGSVRVTELKVVERYSHVMHLVSQVEGQLKRGLGAADVLTATFPAGTVSGSPKVRAMELIDELEPARRGPYAGAVGYVDAFGNMDLAIAIRTLMQSGQRLSVQAGAGIVYDSDPAAEYQESVNKAQALFRALAVAQSGGNR